MVVMVWLLVPTLAVGLPVVLLAGVAGLVSVLEWWDAKQVRRRPCR